MMVEPRADNDSARGSVTPRPSMFVPIKPDKEPDPRRWQRSGFAPGPWQREIAVAMEVEHGAHRQPQQEQQNQP